MRSSELKQVKQERRGVEWGGAEYSLCVEMMQVEKSGLEQRECHRLSAAALSECDQVI